MMQRRRYTRNGQSARLIQRRSAKRVAPHLPHSAPLPRERDRGRNTDVPDAEFGTPASVCRPVLCRSAANVPRSGRADYNVPHSCSVSAMNQPAVT